MCVCVSFSLSLSLSLFVVLSKQNNTKKKKIGFENSSTTVTFDNCVFSSNDANPSAHSKSNTNTGFVFKTGLIGMTGYNSSSNSTLMSLNVNECMFYLNTMGDASIISNNGYSQLNIDHSFFLYNDRNIYITDYVMCCLWLFFFDLCFCVLFFSDLYVCACLCMLCAV